MVSPLVLPDSIYERSSGAHVLAGDEHPCTRQAREVGETGGVLAMDRALDAGGFQACRGSKCSRLAGKPVKWNFAASLRIPHTRATRNPAGE